MGWVRRVRGAISLGIIWALACGAVGGVPRWIFGVNGDAPFAILFAMFGFVAGVTFSVILAIAERRRPFEQMSVPRFAAWGAIGGGVLAALFTGTVVGWQYFIGVGPAFAVASALCASGSLALAKRAARRELSAGTRDAIAP